MPKKYSKKKSKTISHTEGTFINKLEKKALPHILPKLPTWITTDRLTYMTILWGIGLILFYYLSIKNPLYLLLASLMLLLQWVTDLLDGSLGRYRNTGLIKWGYYMDHMLDVLFFGSMIIGLFFVLDNFLLVLLLAILGFSFMAKTFLNFGVLKELDINFMKIISPTEVRFALITFNILLMIYGTDLIYKILYIFLPIGYLALFYSIAKTGNKLYKIDMRNKKRSN